MKRYDIKFSENYYKLPLPMPFKAVLMQVVKVKCSLTHSPLFMEELVKLINP